jgi:hypothetical protein
MAHLDTTRATPPHEYPLEATTAKSSDAIARAVIRSGYRRASGSGDEDEAVAYIAHARVARRRRASAYPAPVIDQTPPTAAPELVAGSQFP